MNELPLSLIDSNPQEVTRLMQETTEKLNALASQQTELSRLIESVRQKLESNPLTLPLALGYAQLHGVKIRSEHPILFTSEGKLVLNTVDVAVVKESTAVRNPPREDLPTCCIGLELDSNGFPGVQDLYRLLQEAGLDPKPFGRNKKQMLAQLSQSEKV